MAAEARRDEYVEPHEITGIRVAEADLDFPNWSLRPLVDFEAVRFADQTPIQILSTKPTGAGTTGAERLQVRFPAFGHEHRLKAKKFPRRLDGFNNSPRKEIAAYVIQRLFLDPREYVVPTTLARCVPMQIWSPGHAGDRPTVAGTDCVLIVMALWLRDVTLPDPLLDEVRFATDADYARHLSNFNVFTYLIDHRDGRRGNFLVSKDDEHRHVFSVDNGISFGPWVFNYFVANWNKLRVPAVRRLSIERLAELSRGDLDFLAVLVQLELDAAGILRIAKPTLPVDPDDGVTYAGGTLQLGLARKEIDGVWRRIERLLARVERGEVETF